LRDGSLAPEEETRGRRSMIDPSMNAVADT